MDKILETLLALPKGCKLLVTVSGGLDSTFVLHAVHTLFSAGAIPHVKSIQVIHVNHKLRGRESDTDEKFVKVLAKKCGIPFFSHSLSWSKIEKVSQESARKKREAIYEKYLASDSCTYILSAHHLDDQAETIFLRLLRGTGLNGLQGMKSIDHERRRVRPLLNMQRSQILSAAQELKLSWREDSSNKSTKYERNWLRLKIFPELEKKRPGFAKRLAALAKEVQAEQKSVEALVAIRHGNLSFYPLEKLQKASDADLAKAFTCERRHLPMLRNTLKKSASRFDLPGAMLWSSCGWVLFAHPKDVQKFLVDTSSDSKKIWKSILGEWHVSKVLRARVRGDGAKIKKILIERRIPAFFRHCIPITVSSKDLLLPPQFQKNCEWQINSLSVHFIPSKISTEIFNTRA